jgi:glycosyltransferase involved in cell wall biosynthesis
VDRVCLAYLDHFADQAQAVVQHPRFRRILDRRSSNDLFELLREPPERLRTALVTGALRRFGGRACSAAGRLYLNIGHTGLDTEGFQSWVGKSGVRPVYFVHDLIPITHPQFCRAGEAETHSRRMRTVLTTASGVIGNSQATLDSLAHFAEAEGFAFPHAIAALLGCTPLSASQGDAGRTEKPTFVAVGTIEGRKNHLLLLEIWSRLVARLGDQAPRLLIIGQRGWQAERVFEILDRDERLRGHVVELNDCSDQELAQHLVGAAAALFPSHAEGFGLPLVEALSLGTPVIASDLPAFHEIGQGVPALLGTADEDAWEAAIVDYARPESAARAAQLERMRHFRPFDWASHFRIVEQWLATLG